MAAGRQHGERELAGQEGHHQTHQKTAEAAGAREELSHRVRFYSRSTLLRRYRSGPSRQKDEKDLKDPKDSKDDNSQP